MLRAEVLSDAVGINDLLDAEPSVLPRAFLCRPFRAHPLNGKPTEICRFSRNLKG